MPLHGKIVVLKRSGGDGTEFPLTATCLFGRKPDCDIRIQLPQVSKEHCRIDLNENKEVILTNLSSVNPTRVNGEVLQQSERLKHGDVITVIDRSFRFEYPPAPTPKKRPSIGGKSDTLKVLQDQQVGDAVTTKAGEARHSEVSTDPHLKDGTNQEHLQSSLENFESKDDSLLQTKTTSPFNDLYQMIKKSLDVKTPRKSSISLLQTPSSRFCTPKPASVIKSDVKPVVTEEKSTPKKKGEAKVSPAAGEANGEADSIGNGTPKSIKKQRKSFQVSSTEVVTPEVGNSAKSESQSPDKRSRATPQRFTVSEVIAQVSAQSPKSPVRRRSKETTPTKPSTSKEQEKQAVASPKTNSARKASPRSSQKTETAIKTSKKRKSGELEPDLPTQEMKKKRVSFGGYLCPELFDKRLPPDSPLRKGAAPRRSLCLSKPKKSLLRRASVIGLEQGFEEYPDSPNVKSPAAVKSTTKSASPKRPSPKAASPGKKTPTSKSSSPKAATSGKKSPTSRSASPKAASPGKKTPTSKSSSPKAATPGKKSPTSRSASPKAATPGPKTPKSRSSSPKAATPGPKTPKSRSSSPKAATPGPKTPTSRASSPKAATPGRGRSPSSNKVETPKTREQPEIQPKCETPGVQTPTVQGRFSVSRISTPSPVAVIDQVPLDTVTPKLSLKRKSISRKTPSVAKSAVKAICRRSGISRASMKASNSWANIVKFGPTKPQVVAPTKSRDTKKTKKTAVLKPQTPARRLIDHVSTGHANSPVTIVVGKAHRQKIVHPAGAAPKLVTNTAVLKKNMKMDEDLTGVSEMFKTPVNERKRRSVNENSAFKTPVGALQTSVVEPSVLNTPEEPGEMMVSPLSVSSTVTGKQYNSEAVQRLLNEDQESSFDDDVPAMETHFDSSEQQCADLQTNTVTTPKQKPELPECLTGVKRIMKTPKQKPEPVEDLRGKLLKTPKQKIEQQDCLTGVKRIMKTPRQKAEPIEDLRGKILKTPKQKPEQQECLSGIKMMMKTPQQEAEPLDDLRRKLLETPKTPQAGDAPLDDKELLETPTNAQKSEDLSETTDRKTPNMKHFPVVCLTGIKRIMKTPKEKSAPVEDMVGVKRLMKTPREKGQPVEENFGIMRLMKSPRLRGNAPVEDFEGLQELMEEPLTDASAQLEMDEAEEQTPADCGGDAVKDAMETISEAAVEQPRVDTVDETVSEEQPEAAGQVTEMETTATDEKKSVRGRRAKTVETKASEEKQEEISEDPVVTGPVRGRRGKKTEATAAPAARQTTRGRNAKATESEDAELAVSKVALKPKRGRNAKKVSNDQADDVVQEAASETEKVPEPESEQSPADDVVSEANESAAAVEKAVSKPKRGRKPKQPEQSEPEQQDVPCSHSDDVPQADTANEMDSNKLEVVPSGSDDNKSSDAKETVTETSPETETATCEVTEMDAAVVQKRSVRGRKARVVESKSAENKQEATEQPEEPVVPAPVRGRRGKKTEATAPPAVRQTTRGRNAKSQSASDQLEVAPEEKAVETPETVSDQTSPVDTSEELDSAPPAEEAVVKPARGRKTKQAPVEPPQPEKDEIVGDKLVGDDQPQQPIPTLEKPRRGRKANPDTVKQNVETTAAVETKQQPPVRAKRGRNAKQDEKQESDDKTSSVEVTTSQEPVKKIRRTRKAEPDHVEPKEEQTVEVVVPEEAPVVSEPVEVKEQTTAKPRRGGRKAKNDAESETPVESTEVQEVPVVSTDKPKRGGRRKQVYEEVEVISVAPEEKPAQETEAEEKNDTEPDAPVSKRGRARGAKASVESEVSQAVPAKRACRGAASRLEETNAESAAPVSESASTSAEPARKGRRAAAKATTEDAPVTSSQTSAAAAAAAEDTKTSKRSVKWKTQLEVFEIQKVTPVKAARGRKTKLADKADTEDKNVSKDAAEEKDLSDEVVEAQPVKRARRGAKVADVTADKAEVESIEAETQPKTRRGRSAKK